MGARSLHDITAMPIRWTIVAVAAAVVVVSLGGCSWLMLTPPPDRDPGVRPVRCSEDRVVPAIDTAAAIALVAGAVAGTLGVAGEDHGGAPASILAITASPALVGVVYALSARYGFRGTGRCRRLAATPASPE